MAPCNITPGTLVGICSQSHTRFVPDATATARVTGGAPT